jgi:hypothetical protein
MTVACILATSASRDSRCLAAAPSRADTAAREREPQLHDDLRGVRGHRGERRLFGQRRVQLTQHPLATGRPHLRGAAHDRLPPHREPGVDPLCRRVLLIINGTVTRAATPTTTSRITNASTTPRAYPHA